MTIKDDKISFSAIAGELRKSARLYEVFKHASEAATVLANFEAEEQKILKSISDLNAEKDDLDEKCEDAAQRKLDTEKSIIKAGEKKAEILKKAQEDAKGIKVKAETEAANILAIADSKLEIVKKRIVDAEEIAQQSISGRNDALKALAAVEKQMQSTKDRFLETLNS